MEKEREREWREWRERVEREREFGLVHTWAGQLQKLAIPQLDS